jgi:hypothetical protein
MAGRRWGSAGVLCGVACAWLALIPGQAAADWRLPSGYSPTAALSLNGSKGYFLFLEGSGRTVTLTVIARDFQGVASYETRGRVSANAIRARFGNRGRILVAFRPSGRIKRKHPPRRCKGEPRTTVPGVFVGRIKFRGEENFTRVSAGRAKGSLRFSSRWRCKTNPGFGRVPSPPEVDDTTLLEATASRSRRSFGVSGWRPPEEHGSTLFSATSIERRGSLKIERFALALGPERTFIFDEALSSATVAPPLPFHGSAIYLLNPDGTANWSGSLSVDFPGADNIPLADKTYTAHLYRYGTGDFARARPEPLRSPSLLRSKGFALSLR